ncbi:LemA family protein [Paenibacillus cisolokensis]|uniref:LemA family protein n=1 Tax=Paenibacillus cisolokensis TaxID=1658519 RepID=UPI003D2AB942
MWIALACAAVVLLFVIILYNNLVAARNNVKEAFAAIDVYLQQRFDALCNIAEAVVAYARHERETLNEITRLRNELAIMSDDEKVEAYRKSDRLVERLTLQVENYPDLKASDNYIHLQKTVNDLEEKLSASRRTYNARVNKYNTMIQMFPANMLAGALGFTPKELLEIDESKKQDVDLKSILRG